MKRLYLCLGLALISATCQQVMLAVPCPAAQPCSCSGEVINCNDKNLRQVPAFTKHTNSFNSLHIQDNMITVLPDNAFVNLTMIANHGNGVVHLQLQRNSIANIEDKAFAGLENVRIAIDLRDNKLSTIPLGLTSLRNLTELQVNNMDRFDSSVMIFLGFSLTTFGFGMSNSMTTWPPEMEYLIRLKNLTISKMDLAHFPFESFRGFTERLEYLQFANSNFSHSPDAICTLTAVKDISMTSIRLLRVVDLIPVCAKSVPSVESLHYDDIQLKYLPDLFPVFPNVKVLSLTNCGLEIVSDTVVPVQNSVQVLRLNNNNFTQVPFEITSMMTQLRELDLSFNEIQTVESNELDDLTHLETLSLNSNPLAFLSKYALKKADALTTFDLGETQLKTVPFTIMHLPKIQSLDMVDSKVECTCELSWFRDCYKIRPGVRISGNCYSTTESLSDFMYEKLNFCPPNSGSGSLCTP